MKATVVGLVTPHVLQVVDLARQAEAGRNVDWHLRDAVTATLEALAQQYNARELLAAYVHGLQAAVRETGPRQAAQAQLLETAAAMASRELQKLA
ncbi:hypothetical protein [Thermomonas flagellata]|uniref:hypothetical protein n=1 Tax=Thermomonas flagellata TaxID=2888524 RepID=UPI001F037467|nr:hypothetical protein [Thermomonas flagellata]